ncbi:calcium-binding protein [Streptomyces sp. NPDC006415]|uniref:calcium-binding protein n=1 Tax=Streptomyces sp. NPDC006415 TaxID=3155351 RepID=UPI0033BEF221
MRIRATVAAVSGALALSALAVPAAQAEDDRSWSVPQPFSASQPAKAESGKAKSSFGATAKAGAAKITAAVLNGGKPAVAGTKTPQTYSLSVTATGVSDIYAYVWKGPSIDDPDSIGISQNEDASDCTAVDATTTTCKMTVTFDPASLYNSDAGSWTIGAAALTNDGEVIENYAVAKTSLQRFSKLTVNAAPEPVKKGATLTVTGKLTRAHWDTNTYKGYTNQPVKLQFRAKNATSYTTVKTVTSSSTGALKATVKASADGYWRYSFAGTSTTPAVSAAGDFVDVK